MSDTPRMDAALTHQGHSRVDVILRLESVIKEGRQLERDLAEAITGWAKQTEMYDQAIKERDEWKACAEEMADWLNLLHKKEQTSCNKKCELAKSIARFNQLKGQTK